MHVVEWMSVFVVDKCIGNHSAPIIFHTPHTNIRIDLQIPQFAADNNGGKKQIALSILH